MDKLCKMLPAHINVSVENIINDLYDSNFAEQNVDLNIDKVGNLNYAMGVKLRFTFVDSFQDVDVLEWRAIARAHGASGIKTKVMTSSGSIDINIEYKRLHAIKGSKIWLIRSMLVLVASWSYHQLHLLEANRYPLPTALLG